MVLAYSCFIFVFISEGRRYFRVHAEMELASEIHRVLVPKIETEISLRLLYGFLGISLSVSSSGPCKELPPPSAIFCRGR